MSAHFFQTIAFRVNLPPDACQYSASETDLLQIDAYLFNG